MENTARKLLIVEDEVRIGQLIRRLIHFDELNLECLGTAENGKDGPDMILREHPDIVITDIRMPKINGLYEMADELVSMLFDWMEGEAGALPPRL